MKTAGKKTMLLLSLTMVMAILLVTACSGNGTKDGSGDGGNGAGATNAAQGGADGKPKLDPVTIKMVVPGVPQKDQAAVAAAISDYLKEDLNITLDLEVVDFASWDQKSNLIISSGEDADIMFSAAWSGFNTNAAKGAFLPLDDLLKQYGQDILNASYNWTLDAAKINGSIYAVPTYQELAQSRGIFLRKDLVDKYGPAAGFNMNDINKLEDLEPMLKAIKDNEPNMTPLYYPPNYYLNYMGLWERDSDSDPAALDVAGGSTTFVNFFDTDFYRNTMNLARKWFVDGYVNKDVAVAKENLSEQAFGQGQAFSYVGNTNPGSDDTVSQRNGGLPVAMYQVNPPYITTGLVQGALFAIPRQSKNPERAMMLIDRMHTDKQLVNMFVYGIEGKHYVKKSDNVIGPAPGIDPANNPYLSPQYWLYGNQALLYTYGDANPDGPKLLDEFNQNAVKSPILGFTYNPEKMKNEISAIANVVAQYNPALSSGAVDPDKDGLYNEFLAKLKSAGADKLIADKQSQLDEWLKQNAKP